MALPTMDLPTYDLVVPSNKKKIKFRPFLVKEEKVLLMALETDNEENIKDAVFNLLKSCVLSKVKLDNLASFDLEYIFLNVRAVSVGEIVQMNVTCQDDETTQVQYNLNITEAKVIFPKGHTNKIMLTDDLGVIMKYPTFDGFVQGQFAQNKEIDVIKIVAESIDQIFQGEEVFDESTTSKKEFIQFVESLTSPQLEKIQTFFETAPRLEHSFKVKNPNTGVESEYTLRGLQSFFG
tara:strand:+ start:499 stop:1206 length:708 start_codon:yes stop_codon:yes gene_type:complete